MHPVKRERGSLIVRLMRWLAAGTVAIWLVAAGLGLFVMQQSLNRSLDSALQETAQRILALAVHEVFEHEDDDRTYEIAQAEIAQHHEYLTYQLRDLSGRVLLRSHDAPSQAFDAPLKTGFFDGSKLRMYTEGTISDTLFIQVAEPHSYRRAAAINSGLALLIPLVLLVPLSAMGIFYVVRQELAPVVNLRNEISARGSGNFDPIGASDLPSELNPIADAVDRLLDRLRGALEAERAFAANSAHELRTPLASVRAQVQRLGNVVRDDAARERVAVIETDLKRLSDLSEKLLQLSRAEAGVAQREKEEDLLPALTAVVDEFSFGRGDASRVALKLGKQPEGIWGRIDPDAFAIVIRNLIENAVKHGALDGAVEVFLSGSRVHVVNGGPPVAAEKLATLTRRFERGASRAPGAGIGLAIAEAILEQVGGRLELHSPARGRRDGFEAIAVLSGPVDHTPN